MRKQKNVSDLSVIIMLPDLFISAMFTHLSHIKNLKPSLHYAESASEIHTRRF